MKCTLVLCALLLLLLACEGLPLRRNNGGNSRDSRFHQLSKLPSPPGSAKNDLSATQLDKSSHERNGNAAELHKRSIRLTDYDFDVGSSRQSSNEFEAGSWEHDPFDNFFASFI